MPIVDEKSRKEYDVKRKRERRATPKQKEAANASQRAYYYRNAEKIIQKNAKRKDEVSRSIKSKLQELKKYPCMDCGVTFPPECMDFDHIPERGAKSFGISGVATRGVSMLAIEEELAKCEVICSNCHRIRTNRRRSAQKPMTKIKWPSNEDLIKMIGESNYVEAGRALGVTDSAVRRHLNKQELGKVLTKYQLEREAVKSS